MEIIQKISYQVRISAEEYANALKKVFDDKSKWEYYDHKNANFYDKKGVKIFDNVHSLFPDLPENYKIINPNLTSRQMLQEWKTLKKDDMTFGEVFHNNKSICFAILYNNMVWRYWEGNKYYYFGCPDKCVDKDDPVVFKSFDEKTQIQIG